MRKMSHAIDVSGRSLSRGDTVTTLSGDLTARIADIAADSDMQFVRLRPMHQPSSRGVWHAADQVVWLATARQRIRKAGAPIKGRKVAARR